MKNLLTRTSLLDAAKGGGKADDGLLRKALVPDEVKAAEGESRSVRFTISTGAVDRDNDTVLASGWKLENYKKNPVVLWAHDYSQLPVGKATQVMVDGAKLVAEMEFADHAFADTVFRMVKGGFLRATSVGFAPHLYKYNEQRGGLDFEEQELLEFSIVPVPANPEALIEARAAGIDVAPLKEWAEAVVKGLKTVTPEERKANADTVAQLEAAAKALAEAPEPPAETGKGGEAAKVPTCTACTKSVGDTYVVRGAITLCAECWQAITPTAPEAPAKAAKDGGDSGMGQCGFTDGGDGTTCSAPATENCTQCGAGMCGSHVHASGVCMACGRKAEEAEADAAITLADEDEGDAVLDIADEETVQLSFDADELRSLLAAQIAESMGHIKQVVQQETQAAINRARGRVD